MRKIFVFLLFIAAVFISCSSGSSGDDYIIPIGNINPGNNLFTEIKLKNKTASSVYLYEEGDSSRTKLEAIIPAKGEYIIKSNIGVVTYYYSFMIDIAGLLVPWYSSEKNSVSAFSVQVSGDKNINQEIDYPETMKSLSSYMILKNSSSSAIKLFGDNSLLSPVDHPDIMLINSGEQFVYEIKTEDFDKRFYIKNAIGTSPFEINKVIGSFEQSKIYTIEFSGSVKLKSAKPFDYIKNTQETTYTITYVLNGGKWKDGFIPATSFRQYEDVNLPLKENLYNDDSIFACWYTDPNNYANSKLEEWKSDINSNITLYAKWKYDINSLPGIIDLCSDRWVNDIVAYGNCIIPMNAIRNSLERNNHTLFSLDFHDVDNCSALYFFGCDNLMSIIIPESATSIGDSAFSSCSNLASVSIPEGVTSIGDSAFSSCSSLASVSIPEGVTSIGDSAFYECSSLASVTIPGSVTLIGDSAFYKCSSLVSVNIPEGVTTIGKYAFWGCAKLSEIRYDGSISDWCAIPDHALSSAGFGTNNGIKYYFNGMLIENSVKVEGIDRIGACAFYGSKELEHIDICEGVTEIGRDAFYDSNLKGDIVLPSTLKEIGSDAFLGIYFDSMNFLSKKPPLIEYRYNNSDSQLGDPKKIYVPKGCAEVYKTARGYTGYASKIFELEE